MKVWYNITSKNQAHLVRTKTLQRIVGELVSHIDQVVVGVNVVQAMWFSLPRCLTHIFAISKQTVEVELIRVFAVCGQARITVEDKRDETSVRYLKLHRRHGNTGSTDHSNHTTTVSWIYKNDNVYSLLLKLQEARLNLRLGVFQRGGGQRGSGWHTGHGSGKLGDRSGQLLPGLERRGRAKAPWHSQAGHLHGRRLGHGNGGSQLIRGTIIGILALVERGLWFNLQVGSEVEANDREVIHQLDALK